MLRAQKQNKFHTELFILTERLVPAVRGAGLFCLTGYCVRLFASVSVSVSVSVYPYLYLGQEFFCIHRIPVIDLE